MAIPMRWVEVERGVYEARCGRAPGHGGCDGRFGVVYDRPMSGASARVADFDTEYGEVSPSPFTPRQGWMYWGYDFQQGRSGPDDEVYRVSENRTKWQLRHQHELFSHPKRSKGITLGRRETSGAPAITPQEVRAYRSGGKLGVSRRRMKTPDPVQPPVEAACPSCGFINDWTSPLLLSK